MKLLIDLKTIKNEYVDQATAAQMLQVTQARISQLCTQGRFNGATKIGWSWIIPKVAVETFERRQRGPNSSKHTPEINNDNIRAIISEAINLKSEGENTI